MTKSMRWGVSALMIVGGVALGAFAGCSSDDTGNNPPPSDDSGTADSGGTDTETPDTQMTDSGSGETATDTGGETGPFVQDRYVTLLFAAPDMPGRFVCLGAFGPTTDPATAMAPTLAEPTAGAFGIPSSAAPTDMTKTTAFPYGSVVPVPLSATEEAGLGSFKVVLYLLDANPAASGSTCSKEWATVKSDPKRWVAVAPGTVKKGESWLVTMAGCVGPADATGRCGAAGNDFEFLLTKLDTAKPTFGSGSGPKVGLQFFNLSQFPGSPTAMIPGFQNVDVYIQPMNAASSGDAGTDAGDGGSGGTAGDKISIATNVKYKDIVSPATPVVLPGDPTSALLVILPHGATYCFNSTPQPSLTCAAWTIPLKKALAVYSAVGGGFVDGTNQFLALMGSPIGTTPTDPTTASLIPAFGMINKP